MKVIFQKLIAVLGRVKGHPLSVFALFTLISIGMCKETINAKESNKMIKQIM